VRVADGSNFTVATTIAAALVTVRPGGVREMHWHPNDDEGRMTVFDAGSNAMTMDFNPGDIDYVERNLGHHVENVGDTDLQFIGVFRAPRYEEISLRLADVYAAGAGCAASQCRRGDHRELADDAPGVMPKS
jgi:oxalate decarboxylase